MESVTIGIDLGTTNTLACYMKKGKPTLFKFDGEKMLASMLYVESDGSLTIGHEAKVKGEGDPDNLIRSSKTFMGDPDKKWEQRGKSLTPTDAAAEILRRVKQTVLKKMKKEEDTSVQAVITVPAYFSGKQKEETRKAGERAGLEILRIITEPMAAAVAAGRTKDLDGKILVVDLGGGTFDLSILEADPQAEEYKAIDTDGDHHLGGDDFDRLLYDYFLERLGEKTGMDFTSLAASGLEAGDYGSLRGRLAAVVENTKKALSESTEKEVSITNLFPYKGAPYTFDIVIDREQFDDICEGLYEKITTRLKNFLERQPFPLDEISSIVLAGGSCYIPRIRTDVEKIVSQQVDTELSLDTLVVIGACIVAEHEASGVEAKGGFKDIISHSMGVEIIDEAGNSVLSKILQKNTPYPCENTRSYTTSVDNQETVNINIYEAGSDAEEILDLDHHVLYGSMTLDGIRPAPKGEPCIQVTFSYDKNQTLKVTAEDQETHVRKQILIRENEKVAVQPQQRPVDFMLLLDASGSMEGAPMREAKNACYALVNEIIDFSVHRLGLASFDNYTHLVYPLGNDAQVMRAKIDRISASGGTVMLPAFREAERALEGSLNGKVIIMVSDGAPFDPDETLLKTTSLRKKGVRIIAIGVGNSINKAFLKQLAGDGLYYTIKNMSELESTFRTAIPAIMEKL